MQIDVLSLFPEFFEKYSQFSVIGRGLNQGAWQINCHDIRQYAKDKHRMADDYPFGGGVGMLLKPELLGAAMQNLKQQEPQPYIIFLSPCGVKLNQHLVRELAAKPRLALICGHYEGIDQRVIDEHVHLEVSIGDYVLSGGELPAMVLIDSIVRLLPGVLGSDLSTLGESFEDGLLEYPQYTRPANYEGHEVPEILLSGNHQAIAKWRRQASLVRTLERRPDLLLKAKLDSKDRAFLLDYLRKSSWLES